MQIQVKIIIGTVAFMLTMILLGYVSLREPARLRAYAAAELGRKIENGAATYEANCSTCHGVNGMGVAGGECFDPSSGEQISCVGRQLNNQALVCEQRPQRLVETDWAGTKYEFINSTVHAGRPWAGMPTWGSDFGGPLSYNQVDDVTEFILNWGAGTGEDSLCAQEIVLTVWPASVTELPAGDIAAGEAAYLSNGCQGCHGDPAVAGSNTTGPWLGRIAIEGDERRDGYLAADYIYESVLLIDEYIAPGWSVCDGLSEDECQAQASIMNASFALSLDQQGMSDIIAYLLDSSEHATSGVEVDVQQVNPEPVEEEAPAEEEATEEDG